MSDATPPSAAARTPKSTFTTAVEARQHRVVADEPGALGGRDGGMTPIEMLLGSLCSCTTITVRMYADRKGWPLAEVRAEARGVRHSTTAGPLDAIELDLTLTGDLDDAQRERLLDIAGKCPVHRTIAHGVEVRIAAVG